MPLVPDLVIAFITAPLNFPYSASKLLVISRNSSTESRLGTKPAPRFRPSLTSPPFTRKAFAVSRWPFTERLPGFKLPDTGRSCWIAWLELPGATPACKPNKSRRSEEHTSELQSRLHLVCRLLLEKKKKTTQKATDEPIPLPHSHMHRPL